MKMMEKAFKNALATSERKAERKESIHKNIEKFKEIGIVEQNATKDYYIIRHKIEVKDKSELSQSVKSHGYDFVIIRGKETAKKTTN